MSEINNPVLLDGKHVAGSSIDPAKHRYIGMFRPAINGLIPSKPVYAVICTCGHHLKFHEECISHYRSGCIDIPQYVSIDSPP